MATCPKFTSLHYHVGKAWHNHLTAKKPHHSDRRMSDAIYFRITTHHHSTPVVSRSPLTSHCLPNNRHRGRQGTSLPASGMTANVATALLAICRARLQILRGAARMSRVLPCKGGATMRGMGRGGRGTERGGMQSRQSRWDEARRG